VSWNPVKAKNLLDTSPLTSFVREVNKVSGFEFESGRELALIRENKEKVSVYVSIAPQNMHGVKIDREYTPTDLKSGRNADVEAVSRSLGFSHTAYSLHVQSEEAFHKLLNWYQYA